MNRTVWIADTTLADMIEEAERVAPGETGGVFVGYGTTSDEMVVTRLVGPGPDAIHEEDRFVPDYGFHEQQIARHFEKSGGTETYLGDWHTHPRRSPYLSSKDLRTLRRIAWHREARIHTPLMGVLGGESGWYLAVWRYRAAAARLLELLPHRRTIRCVVRRF